MIIMTTDQKLNHEEKVQENRKLAEQGLKHCRKCDRILPLDDFPIYKPKKLQERGWGDGHSSICKACMREYSKKRRANANKINSRVNDIIRAAKKAGELCEITVPYMEYLFYKEQNGLCEVSDLPMNWESGSPDKATITRFNPYEPFVKGNVAWVRDRIAKAMKGLSYETYLEISRAIDQYRPLHGPNDEYRPSNPAPLKSVGSNDERKINPVEVN
jgi:hypothetical protein